jgi:hypothetical protein
LRTAFSTSLFARLRLPCRITIFADCYGV